VAINAGADQAKAPGGGLRVVSSTTGASWRCGAASSQCAGDSGS